MVCSLQQDKPLLSISEGKQEGRSPLQRRGASLMCSSRLPGLQRYQPACPGVHVLAEVHASNRKDTLLRCCATAMLLASKERTTLACAPRLLHEVAHWHAESFRLWRRKGPRLADVRNHSCRP